MGLTLCFLSIVGLITLYLYIGPREEEALEAASRLPGEFVAGCRQVAEETGTPWHYLAAYFQVSLEKEKPDAYPGEKEIRQLAGKIGSSKGRSIKGKLRELEGSNKAKIIIRQAKLLEKGGVQFSPDFTFPVQQKEIWYTDTWLAPRDGGERQHLGADIFAPEGTPVYACTDGTINRIGWNELGGNRIGLLGKDGIYYYYAHLSAYATGIEEGSKIAGGQLLGYVGHTGNAVGTPDHLHFGMLVNWDKWINPYNFLVYWELQQK